jgi:hypothetical protein
MATIKELKTLVYKSRRNLKKEQLKIPINNAESVSDNILFIL